jgi:alpha-beta hydrolase superfamily lysophospholipase
VIERPDGSPLAGLVGHLTALGAKVDVRAIDGSQCCLDEPTEFATVPEEIVAALTDWIAGREQELQPRSAPAPAADRDRDRVELEVDGATIVESVAPIGPRGLVGIVGLPAGTEPVRATVVFANSGSEPHIGPGRAWVEYARGLNRAGFRTVRLDCRGWGESPDDGFAPARPYDAHMATDLREVTEWVGTRGWSPAVLVGQCASAWMALDIARQAALDGVIACNPQLYWQPGDPKDVNMTVTRERRAPERERIKRLGRYGWWSLLDRLGARDPAARFLHDVNAHGTPTLLLFGHDDDGIEYLRDRAGRALAREKAPGRIQVIEMPGIDHGMQRAWLRDEVSSALLDFLCAIAPSEPSMTL